MKYGVSSDPKRISNGSGSPLMSPLNRSSPFTLVIVRLLALRNCGGVFRQLTVPARHSIRTVWQPIRQCFLQKGIRSAPRGQDIPISSNDSIDVASIPQKMRNATETSSGFSSWAANHPVKARKSAMFNPYDNRSEH